MKHYVSEATQFIDQLKDERPHLEGEQRKGRALLWDKKLDDKQQQDFKEAKVPQHPYVYSSSLKQK